MNKLTFDQGSGLAHLLNSYHSKLPWDDSHAFPSSAKDRSLYDWYLQELKLTEVLNGGKALGTLNNSCSQLVGQAASLTAEEKR